MALTKRYVSVAGSGTNSGVDASNEMTWAQMVTDINTPRVGYKYLVKAGTYANATTTTTITGDGTAASPNVIEGYNSTEGDLLANGWSASGLVTTNFPEISYTGGTAYFNTSGATHLVIRCLKITSAASNYTLRIFTNSEVEQCHIRNTGTNAASACIELVGNDATVTECDLQTASTGSTRAVRPTTRGLFIGCRIKCVPGIAIDTTTVITVTKCTIYESTTGIASTSNLIATDNTIVNCTGNGIDIGTGNTNVCRIVNNHITGCVYAIELNTTGAGNHIAHNRFRDNTSGDIHGGGNWEEGTSVHNVTSDDTDATDFTSQSTGDYSLLVTAAAVTAGTGYRNAIGAHGPGSFPVPFINTRRNTLIGR